jgi:opacity protein-like surface antigen
MVLRSVAMRRFLLAAVVVIGAHNAHAADMPDFGPLRGALPDGPARVVNWQGFYVGGQAGYGASDVNFVNSTKGVVEQLLANTTIQNEMSISTWPVLGKQSVKGQGFGGFVGYNSQWDDVVIGLEANYLHASFLNSASGTMTRGFTTSDSAYHIVQYEPSATMNVRDVGSVRARAGYAVGSFLPYMFGGISLGMADVNQTATIYDCTGSCLLDPSKANSVKISNSVSQNAHFLYGYSGGIGVDMMLFGGLFVRAEWEYQKFAAPIDTSVSTVRGGVGYKF